MSEEKPNEHMKALSRAIVEALVRDPAVRQALVRAAGSDDFTSHSYMVMMLKLQALAEAMGIDPACLTEEELADAVDPDGRTGPLQLRPVVDGRSLTESETAFREWLVETFDQEEWLRHHRLIF